MKLITRWRKWKFERSIRSAKQIQKRINQIVKILPKKIYEVEQLKAEFHYLNSKSSEDVRH